MRILFVHNRYQQPGGEDAVVSAEMALLRDRGHDVMLLEENNDAIVGSLASIKASFRAVYSWDSMRNGEARIKEYCPDVVHVHNFFPRFSPSIYDACRNLQTPVVQTLHNYRMLCVNALFYRGEKPCGECMGKSIGWPGIWHHCYRDSQLGSAAVVTMQVVHKLRGTWTTKVDRFVALTEFARNKFVSAGLPESKISCKSNFLQADPGVGSGCGGYALFVGRLSPEKGISTLLATWQMLGGDRKLKIAGDGPMGTLVSHAAKRNKNIEWVGRCTSEEVYSLMRSSAMVVFPSEWYEGFPMVLAEAFATGTPVIASRIGGLGEIVEHGRTGLLFTAGDARALASAVEWAFAHPLEIAAMRQDARAEYALKYTPDRNYELLMDVYEQATQENRSGLTRSRIRESRKGEVK